MISGVKPTWVVLGVLIVVALVAIQSSLYTLDETEQAVVVQFGAPVGDPVTEPGLHVKVPFIQEVRRFDRRLLAWDGDPNQVPTRGREFISVDTTARWRIADPLLFLKSVRDERGAQTRLDDIVDSVVRDKISSTELVEIVRSKDWEVKEEKLEELPEAIREEEAALTKTVEMGREKLVRDIIEEARKAMPNYGIELRDVRIKRLNYVPSVQKQVFNRMISERQRIAERFRAEGQGESAQILGQTQRELAQILSEARREAEVIRGQADAKATRVYNEAYGANPEFYSFYRTLISYDNALGKDFTLMLKTDSDFLRYLRRIFPDASAP